MDTSSSAPEYLIGELLRQKGWKLALAESCTGGLVGHRVTEVPGSSDYFLGGVISYAYEAKEALLGVRHETLLAYGAVSEETALEMARGARAALGADVAISVTGIAGPGGAQPGKPVGLTWVGLSAPDGERAWRYIWQGSRSENKAASAEAALLRLVEYLRGAQADELQVRARFDAQGQPQPAEFTWQGRRWPVVSTGRRWQDDAGQHVLCQVGSGAVFELVYDPRAGAWRIGFHNEQARGEAV